MTVGQAVVHPELVKAHFNPEDAFRHGRLRSRAHGMEDIHEEGPVRENPRKEVLLGRALEVERADELTGRVEDRNVLSIDIPGDERVAGHAPQSPQSACTPKLPGPPPVDPTVRTKVPS